MSCLSDTFCDDRRVDVRSINPVTMSVQWLPQETAHGLCDLRRVSLDLDQEKEWVAVGFVLMYASWNSLDVSETAPLLALAADLTQGLEARVFATTTMIDESEDSLSVCIGDNHHTDAVKWWPLPPSELPALAIVLQTSSMEHSTLRYVQIPAIRLSKSFESLEVRRATRRTLQQLEADFHLAVSNDACRGALRIFVAGDKSSVGKSSVCLGIIGNLLQSNYTADELAYIKPATQSESTQLIERYCQKNSIDCVPIGPLVYYRGFTRAFLSGETEDTATLLDKCAAAVDRLARGKKVVLIDGVGFPAVGSICGTDNASVAKACGSPIDQGRRKPPVVLLVGGSGVGAAVDGFNLNATYFEMAGVPVIGAIFNKLALDGFYSLESCREQVTRYFDQCDDQIKRSRRPFGFVPLYPEIAGVDGMNHVDAFLGVFGSHVSVEAILEAARGAKQPTPVQSAATSNGVHAPKRRKLNTSLPIRSRQEIETQAIVAGAAPSA